ncbi:MAG: hypothetical protein MUE33_09030 [Cytophagaceae bacterium]|jgi:hypothetical protein|nr:hypothetical protein [Cytophagaceae bacterium]
MPYRIVFYILIVVGISACDIKKNKEATPDAFLRIYNTDAYAANYTALDVEETAEGGYLILCSKEISESPFPGIYFLRTDAMGQVLSETEWSTEYVSPVSNLLKVNNQMFCVSMLGLTTEAVIHQVSDMGQVLQSNVVSDVYFPLAINTDNSNRIVLQHYNKDDITTLVSVLQTNGAVVESRAFSIASFDFPVEEKIIDHLTRTGRVYPFDCGQAPNGNYYFNGFVNYTFSLAQFQYSWPWDAYPATVQGFRDERGLSAVLFTGSSSVASATFNFGKQFIGIEATVPTSSGTFTSSSDIPTVYVPEWQATAPVILKRIVNNSQVPHLLYGCTTKSQQMQLMAFNENTKQLIQTIYLGDSNPFILSNFIRTSDGGMVIVGSTEIAGRFTRICMYRWSKDALFF